MTLERSKVNRIDWLKYHENALHLKGHVISIILIKQNLT